jgi:hypothetical protein
MKLLPAAAAVAVLGSGVGLAAADTLPAPAQEVAHKALGVVGVHVPPGHERFNDPAECPGGPYRNHGAYVKAHKDDPDASKSRCGKPLHAGVGDDETDRVDRDAKEKKHDKDDHTNNGRGKKDGQGQGKKHGATHEKDDDADEPETDGEVPSSATPSSAPAVSTSVPPDSLPPATTTSAPVTPTTHVTTSTPADTDTTATTEP